MLVNIFDGNWNDGYLVDGGRNYIRSFNSNNYGYPLTMFNVNENIISLESNNVNLFSIAKYFFECSPNSKYIVSFKIIEGSKYSIAVGFYDDTNTIIENGVVVVHGENESFNKYYKGFRLSTTDSVITMISPDNAVKMRISIIPNWNDFDGKYIIKDLKLERGTIATPWTPAPEDTFDLGTAHPDSIFTNVIPIKKKCSICVWFS